MQTRLYRAVASPTLTRNERARKLGFVMQNDRHRSRNGRRRATLRVHEAHKKHAPSSTRRLSFDWAGRRSNLWIRRRSRFWRKFGNWWDDISGYNARRACCWLDTLRAGNSEPFELGVISALPFGTSAPRNSRSEHNEAVRSKWHRRAGSFVLEQRARSEPRYRRHQ